jgi:hypothetical protein
MDIDVVMLWVDSSDDNWRKKINKFLEKKIDWNNKKGSTRYNSINEIEIAITSVIKHASYVRNIFLVTDNQKPKRFEELKDKAKKRNINLILIDHKEIFKGNEEYLPTFNCLTIEALIYKIPELSEYFVYFNDDFFLIKETKPEDFFIKNKPVLRGKWLEYDENRWITNLMHSRKRKRIFCHRFGKQDTAKLLGFDKYYDFHHTPHPIRKSTIKSFFEKDSNLLEDNLKHKFRHKSQILLQGLANHLEIKAKTCILKSDLSLVYTHKYSWFSILKKVLKSELRAEKELFLCLQSLETVSKPKLKFLLKWIDKKLDSNFVQEL